MSFTFPKRIFLPASLITAMLALAACQPIMPTGVPTTLPSAAEATTPFPVTPPADPPPPPPAVAIVRINLGRAPATLDPLRVAPLDSSANDLVENLFIGLASFNPQTQRIEPALARGWEQLEDGITWYVYLRDDVFWVRIDPSTSTLERIRPLNAADVVYTVQRACRADSGAPLGSRPAIFVIRGCREVYEHDITTLTPDFVQSTLGVRVLNDVAVEFKLTADTAIFPTLLTLPMLHPVPAELVAAEGDGWADPSVIWTSGPYALWPTSSTADGYTLVANEAWPLERSGNVERVEIAFDETAEQSFHAWQTGKLDLTEMPASASASAPFGHDPSYRLLAKPVSVFLVAAYEVAPMDNADVRHALSLALDRQTLVREVLFPNGVIALPATTIIPPGTAAAPKVAIGTDYDPEAAQEALSQAGYPGCEGLPPITLLTDGAFNLSAGLARGIVAMWNSVLGCRDVFSVEQRPLLDLYAELQTQPLGAQPRAALTLLGWQADYPDAHHWLADLMGCREFFPTAYLDQARPCIGADALLLDAAALHDEEARAALYGHALSDFFGPQGEMPLIPLYFFARPIAVHLWLDIGEQQAGPLRFDRWMLDITERP